MTGVGGLIPDKEWRSSSPLLSRPHRSVVAPPGNHHLVLDSVFWIFSTGAGWRDLSEEVGKWDAVHCQFGRWSVAGFLIAISKSAGMASSRVYDQFL